MQYVYGSATSVVKILQYETTKLYDYLSTFSINVDILWFERSSNRGLVNGEWFLLKNNGARSVLAESCVSLHGATYIVTYQHSKEKWLLHVLSNSLELINSNTSLASDMMSVKEIY